VATFTGGSVSWGGATSTFNNPVVAATITTGGLTAKGNVSFGKYASFDPNATLCMKNAQNVDVCLTSDAIDKLNKLPMPTATASTNPRSVTGLTITHPDGRVVKADGAVIRLNKGSPITVNMFNDSSVDNNKNGNVGLFVGGDRKKALRHTGYVIYADEFQAGNFDFSWKLIRNGNGFDIINDFGGGTFLGYDSTIDQLRIVSNGDGRKVTWNITAPAAL
jgi:hypothetical protein